MGVALLFGSWALQFGSRPNLHIQTASGSRVKRSNGGRQEKPNNCGRHSVFPASKVWEKKKDSRGTIWPGTWEQGYFQSLLLSTACMLEGPQLRELPMKEVFQWKEERYHLGYKTERIRSLRNSFVICCLLLSYQFLAPISPFPPSLFPRPLISWSFSLWQVISLCFYLLCLNKGRCESCLGTFNDRIMASELMLGVGLLEIRWVPPFIRPFFNFAGPLSPYRASLVA